MIDKQKRQDAIAALVETGSLGSQKAILKSLAKDGLGIDQSTLSRDLAELGIRKVDGQYCVVTEQHVDATVETYFAGVVRFTTCGPHQIVVFTEVGLAQPVAVAIEQKNDPAILATLGGDDVIFVATKSRSTQAVALRRFKQWMGAHKYEQ